MARFRGCYAGPPPEPPPMTEQHTIMYLQPENVVHFSLHLQSVHVNPSRL